MSPEIPEQDASLGAPRIEERVPGGDASWEHTGAEGSGEPPGGFEPRPVRSVSNGPDTSRGGAFDALQERLGVWFQDPLKLRAAFLHESYVHEVPDEVSNERLEFLGDAVVGLIVSEMLYERFPHSAEGELTRMKGMLVSRVSLAAQARDLEFGAWLLLSRGGAAAGERERASLLADVFEAVVGAIFLDRGWETVRTFVRTRFQRLLDELPTTDRNFKSILQHVTQQHWRDLPTYSVVGERGPSHARSFAVEVSFRGALLGRGEGCSKKEAEQEAARMALSALGSVSSPNLPGHDVATLSSLAPPASAQELSGTPAPALSSERAARKPGARPRRGRKVRRKLRARSSQ